MKLLYSWLNDFVALKGLSVERVADTLTMIGLEVEGVTALADRLTDAKAGKVEQVIVPEYKRLHLRVIADGQAYDIVTTELSVTLGETIVFVPVGGRIQGEPVAAKILSGVATTAVAVSQFELGVGAEADRVWRVRAQKDIRLRFGDDWIVEIKITPNRGDCLSHQGVARDLAAALGKSFRPRRARPVRRTYRPLKVSDKQGCRQYFGARLTGVEQKPLPESLGYRLAAIGQRPISPIVDVTNYVLHDVGQPMHAFDASKLTGAVDVRRARADENVQTLDGQTRKLSGDDLVIADGSGAIALAGVMGGATTEIEPGSREVFLEAAEFDPVRVRRTGSRLQLQTDSRFRFERGVDGGAVGSALESAIDLYTKHLGARVVDVVRHGRPAAPRKMVFDDSAVARIGGFDIEPKRIHGILNALGFAPEPKGKAVKSSRSTLSVPTWRNDVSIIEDLVEEVLRIYGFGRMAPVALPVSAAPARPAATGVLRAIRHSMLELGINEAVNLDFAGALIDGISDIAMPVLANPIDSAQPYLRPGVIIGLLPSVAFNVARQQTDVRLFEMARGFVTDSVTVREQRALAVALTGKRMPSGWRGDGGSTGIPELRQIADAVAAAAGVSFEFASAPAVPWLRESPVIVTKYDGKPVGFGGMVADSIRKKLDIEMPLWAIEINLEPLLAAAARAPLRVAEEPHFPFVERDVSLIVGVEQPAGELVKLAEGLSLPHLEDFHIFDLYAGKGMEPGQKAVGLRFRFRAINRTLTAEEVDDQIQRVVVAAAERLGAKLRG